MVEAPLIVLAGPTASGKSHLALRLAEAFAGEIVSCDSVAVFRRMEIGTAKPSPSDRALVPHHMIDVAEPTETFSAGDYSRQARQAIRDVSVRGHLPIVVGGTGLYLRALLEGLFPAPPQQPALRQRLRERPAQQLYRILLRLDRTAAKRIHPNDSPKLIRAVEVSLAARRPITDQWQQGRDPLTGHRILRLALSPPRGSLYDRVNSRAAAMFLPDAQAGLIGETRGLLASYGEQRAFTSLGYAQALSFLREAIPLAEAVRQTQQGHRNYAKRQLTWFRHDPGYHWLNGFGDDPVIVAEATEMVGSFLRRPLRADASAKPSSVHVEATSADDQKR